MNKLLVYGLSGVLGGVLATVALLLATIKAAPQTVAQTDWCPAKPGSHWPIPSWPIAPLT